VSSAFAAARTARDAPQIVDGDLAALVVVKQIKRRLTIACGVAATQPAACDGEELVKTDATVAVRVHVVQDTQNVLVATVVVSDVAVLFDDGECLRFLCVCAVNGHSCEHHVVLLSRHSVEEQSTANVGAFAYGPAR
jgi:hypothetical protein